MFCEETMVLSFTTGTESQDSSSRLSLHHLFLVILVIVVSVLLLFPSFLTKLISLECIHSAIALSSASFFRSLFRSSVSGARMEDGAEMEERAEGQEKRERKRWRNEIRDEAKEKTN